jgi:asparagine synthase (glutamine-hydrolysing)
MTREAYADTLGTLDRAPPSVVASSVMEAISQNSALPMRRGIWPVHPLATPELAWFCRSLPRRGWREDRNVERDALVRQGCPATVSHPRSTDSFTSSMILSLADRAQPFVKRLFEDSYLAVLGYLDRDALLADYERFCASHNDGADVWFCAVALLELMLRSLHETAPRAT